MNDYTIVYIPTSDDDGLLYIYHLGKQWSSTGYTTMKDAHAALTIARQS